MLEETCARIHNKRMLIEQDCVKFCGRIAWQSFLSFLINNFVDHPDVLRVKKSRFRSADGGISLQQHLILLWFQGLNRGVPAVECWLYSSGAQEVEYLH